MPYAAHFRTAYGKFEKTLYFFQKMWYNSNARYALRFLWMLSSLSLMRFSREEEYSG